MGETQQAVPVGDTLRVALDALDAIRRGGGGVDPMGRMEMARAARCAIDRINDLGPNNPGPALCVWCGATVAEGDWDTATAIAASKEHVQKCARAPWMAQITALADALEEYVAYEGDDERFLSALRDDAQKALRLAGRRP